MYKSNNFQRIESYYYSIPLKDFYISRISGYSSFVYVDSSRLLQQLRREKEGEAEKERSRNEEKALTEKNETEEGSLSAKVSHFHFLPFLSSNFTRIFCKGDFSEAYPSHPPYVSDLAPIPTSFVAVSLSLYPRQGSNT